MSDSSHSKAAHTMMLDGWEIDIELLPGPTRGEAPYLYCKDEIFPSPDSCRAVVLYTICELAMGWNVGLLAVFENRDNPRLILNPSNFTCAYTTDSVTWLTPKVFAIKKFFTNPDINSRQVPFLLIDLARQAYSYIPLQNSYLYELSCTNNVFELHERRRDERFESHNGRQYAVQELEWRGLNRLGEFNQWYTEHVERQGQGVG